MKVLFVSNLYPDAAEPNRGSDNAALLKAMAPHCEIRVLSPRPLLGFPFRRGRQFAACPGDEVFHPVFRTVSYIPKFGSRFNHRLMARDIRPALQDIRRKFPFDVALASWIYPDVCAASLLATEQNFPFVAVAQGSDVHQYLQMPARRQIILEALQRSAGVIARSGELVRLLAQAGVEEGKLHRIYNGIDPQIFHPADRMAARAELNLPPDASIILFAGNFLPIKNPALLVEAHAELCRRQADRPVWLVMLGSGPLGAKIRKQADALGVGARVLLPGRKSLAEVARYMQAANVFCLSSDNEGFPNVILEAFACGLRVVSTWVGGIPELLCHPWLGQLVERGSASALANALAETLAQPPEPEKILQQVAKLSWKDIAGAYLQVLRHATGNPATRVEVAG